MMTRLQRIAELVRKWARFMWLTLKGRVTVEELADIISFTIMAISDRRLTVHEVNQIIELVYTSLDLDDEDEYDHNAD